MHVYMYVQQDHKPLVQNPPSWDSKSRDLLLMRCDEDELPAMQSKLHLDMIILHVISRIGRGRGGARGRGRSRGRGNNKKSAASDAPAGESGEPPKKKAKKAGDQGGM